jgi:hypothetical protein
VDGQWLVIEWQGGNGWVFGGYIQLDSRLTVLRLPVVDTPSTPTATPPPSSLFPPPSGTGRVLARVLVVRQGPGMEWPSVGGLDYGATVYPIGRSADSAWVVIDWQGQDGWVTASYVMWDPALSISDLPMIEPPPVPAATATQAATLSPSPVALPTDTPLPPASATIPTQAASPPTATLSSPTDTLAPATAVAAVPTVPSAAQPGEPETVAPPGAFNRGLASVGGALGILAGLVGLVAVYGIQRNRRLRELQRYSGGFPIRECPVCQTGSLHLDEHIWSPFGLPQIKRTVRCDTCHSVMREVRPGLWRYTIDPLANPDMADQRNGAEVSDIDLPGFAHDARSYTPSVLPRFDTQPSPDYQDAVEHLEALEATIMASQAEEESAAADEAATGDGGPHEEAISPPEQDDTPRPEDQDSEQSR